MRFRRSAGKPAAAVGPLRREESFCISREYSGFCLRVADDAQRDHLDHQLEGEDALAVARSVARSVARIRKTSSVVRCF